MRNAMSVLENVVSDSSLQRGEVKGGGHTAHAEDSLALLILQRESSWCFLSAIKSNS